MTGQDANHRRVGHEHLGSTVEEHLRPFRAAQPGVEGHGDGADPESAEEGGHPGETVGKEHGHALLGLHTESSQPLARPVSER